MGERRSRWPPATSPPPPTRPPNVPATRPSRRWSPSQRPAAQPLSCYEDLRQDASTRAARRGGGCTPEDREDRPRPPGASPSSSPSRPRRMASPTTLELAARLELVTPAASCSGRVGTQKHLQGSHHRHRRRAARRIRHAARHPRRWSSITRAILVSGADVALKVIDQLKRGADPSSDLAKRRVALTRTPRSAAATSAGSRQTAMACALRRRHCSLLKKGAKITKTPVQLRRPAGTWSSCSGSATSPPPAPARPLQERLQARFVHTKKFHRVLADGLVRAAKITPALQNPPASAHGATAPAAPAAPAAAPAPTPPAN